ncbi:MAG: hypothetical protein H7Y36_03175 [Armatimonadetes bacterium]|nr:hypothetical protein [Akkermansiaceae bacterium]
MQNARRKAVGSCLQTRRTSRNALLREEMLCRTSRDAPGDLDEHRRMSGKPSGNWQERKKAR